MELLLGAGCVEIAGLAVNPAAFARLGIQREQSARHDHQGTFGYDDVAPPAHRFRADAARRANSSANYALGHTPVRSRSVKRVEIPPGSQKDQPVGSFHTHNGALPPNPAPGDPLPN